MARQLRNRRSVLGVTLVDVIGMAAVFPILAVLSVPSFTNVTEAYLRREGLVKVDRAPKAVESAGTNLLTKESGQ